MKCSNCVIFFLLMTLTLNAVVTASEIKLVEELQALTKQIELLKTLHLTDVTRLRNELDELKQQVNFRPAIVDHIPLDNISMEDLRAEVSEIRDGLNATARTEDLQNMRQELKQVLVEHSELAQLARAQQQRADKLEAEMSLMKQADSQLKAAHVELKSVVHKMSKKVKTKKQEDATPESILNEVDEDAWEQHAHHLRHHKTISNQVYKIVHDQDLLDQRQDSLQAQLFNVQTRLDHFQEPNWVLLSTKVEMLELENKILRDEIKNNSQTLSDLGKLHASVLELREEVEAIENKADNTVPELRVEISKLDISFAQLTAQSSYLKEDQENLRQSVKAIAVSVSNAIDRAETDRAVLHRVNESVGELRERARLHFHRLNDHILKSEANHVFNETETISLPELMGEVKELQPVENEYQDLVKQLPRDCTQVTGPPGVYVIRPGYAPIDAWCANGSTLLQRRYNGTVEFNRKFSEYVRGFGDASSEYWLGLDAMHRLTADNCSSMRIDMTDIYGGSWYAQYEHFTVGDGGSGFFLEVSGFKGNASDAFEYQNHMEFSTVDRDRDISNTHCASNYEGGWWFSHCQHVNINGKYTLGLTWFDSTRNEWIAVATSEMRLYRRPGCL